MQFQAPVQEQTITIEPTQEVGNSPHILVIDDETDILWLVTICLEQVGYAVSTVTSTEEAYCLISNFEFDVILSDVMMPGEDGIAFLSRIHQILPDVPVVIMTGYAQLQTAVDAIKNGAFEFIHKPFDLVYLQQVIRKALTFSRLRRIEKQYREELEEAVARRTDELKLALAQLEATRTAVLQAAREKTEFITNVSHEMRTPMNGVIGALDLLADTELSGQQLEYLGLARQAADNMVELVDQVVSFSRGVGRAPTVSAEQVDLPALIEAVAAAHEPQFTANGLSFDVEVKASVPGLVRGDSRQLTRLLEILLNNALKFTENGWVKLEVSAEQIPGRDVELSICISDSGIGIASEMIGHIFDPFIQADGSLRRRYGGAGLGLSIARQIATLFNGEIRAESKIGEGSRFYCRLRFDPA